MSTRHDPTTIWRDLVTRIIFAILIIAFGLTVVGYVQKIAMQTIQNAAPVGQQTTAPPPRKAARK